MNYKKLYDEFENGRIKVGNKVLEFESISWNEHKDFEGVELKHIITGDITNQQFSYHLVKIEPNKEIGFHIHENQLETHEVISGTGEAINHGEKVKYSPGVVAIFEKGISHKVVAGENGLYIFAKFMPSLC